jgi:hypothetical protein
VNIELDEKDWDERRNINKRKKLILEGKDPDEVKKEQVRRRKKELKREKKARLKAAALLAAKTEAIKGLKAETDKGSKQKKKPVNY